jgi:hypothetical protein
MPTSALAPRSAARLGVKNDGMPRITVAGAEHRARPSQSNGFGAGALLDLAPEASSASIRVPGALPQISAALIAPIEVPITQSGSMPASCSAW